MMPESMICPHGHRWESPPAPDAGAHAPEQACPICGAAGAPAASPNTVHSTSVETLVYRPNPRTEDSPTTLREAHPRPQPSPADIAASAETYFARKLDEEPELPKVLGFDLIRELGRGGMGVVYLAHQEGLDRFVALKMILSGAHAGSEEFTRFRIEAAAISRLQHPNLVQIYGIGEHEGQPYFALEFVDGGSVDDCFNGKPQPAQPVAHLVETLARAIHFAHQRNIIHRDLKPANVLMTIEGVPKITDFGLAKRMDSGVEHTATGAIMGTPSYMAPEQAAGKSNLIGPHTDVYALGAIMYEFLTGRPPFIADTSWDTIMQVVNQEPLPPTRMQPRLPRDLETICLKCLEKEPRKRYASAEELADDLARFQSNEPIRARPIGAFERSWKWIKRHPAGSALVGLTALMIAALLTSGYFYHRKVEQYGERNRQGLVRMYVARGVNHLDQSDGFGALVWFAKALAIDRQSPESEAMHRMRIASALRQCPRMIHLWIHASAVRHASFSPDGARVVSASEDKTARIWDVVSGDSLCPPLEHDAPVIQAWFSKDGQRVLTASANGAARVWEAHSGKPIAGPMKHGSAMQCAQFSSDSRLVLTAGETRSAFLWDAASGRRLTASFEHTSKVNYATFSPDGRRVITASDDKTAQVWDVQSNSKLGAPLRHDDGVLFAVFSSDGRTIVTTSLDQTARLWNAETSQIIGQPMRHSDVVRWASFSPDNTRVVTASDDDTARLWDARTGQVAAPVLRHESDVRRYTCFSPDGCMVATASDDNTARFWNAMSGEPATTILKHNGTVRCAVFSSKGRHVLTVSDDTTVRLWDLATDSLLHSKQELSGLSRMMSELAAKPASVNLEKPNAESRQAKSADGTQLLVIKNNEVQILNATTGEPMAPPLRHRDVVLHAGFSPKGRWVVTASADRTARVWDAHTGTEVGEPLSHASVVTFADFSPGSGTIVTTSGDNSARLWHTKSGTLLTPPLQHHGTVQHAAFSADGTMVATAGKDRVARVWDVRTGESLTPKLVHPREVSEVAFVDDGKRLRTRCRDQIERTWDLPRDDRPVTSLARLGEILSGKFVDEQGVFWTLNVDMLDKSWQELKQSHPEFLDRSDIEIMAWHVRTTSECENGHNWPGALWHLQRLLALDQKNPGYLERRGNAFAEMRDWTRAAEDFDQASSSVKDSSPADLAYRMALISHMQGETRVGQLRRDRMLQRYAGTKDPIAAFWTVRACNMVPDGDINRAEVVALAETTAASFPKSLQSELVLGAALFRANRLDEALAALNEVVSRSRGLIAAEAHCFLALIYKRQKNDGLARRQLELASQQLNDAAADSEAATTWMQRQQVRVIHEEVAASLK